MSDRARCNYLRELAEFASSATSGFLSTEARDCARWVIADCIPVIAAGMQQREMKALVAGVREMFARPAERGSSARASGRRRGMPRS